MFFYLRFDFLFAAYSACASTNVGTDQIAGMPPARAKKFSALRLETFLKSLQSETTGVRCTISRKRGQKTEGKMMTGITGGRIMEDMIIMATEEHPQKPPGQPEPDCLTF